MDGINKSIPIFDLKNIHNENYKNEISQELLKYAQTNGFFYLKNHGIEKETIEKLKFLKKKFFLLPNEEKQKFKKSENANFSFGYSNFGEQQSGGVIDHKESYHIPFDTNKSQFDYIPTKSQEEKLDIVGFNNVLSEYVKGLESICLRILDLICISLNIPESFIKENYAKTVSSSIGLLKYPTMKNKDDLNNLKDSEKFACGQHTDYGFMTILYQDDHENCIQIKSLEGNFVNVPYIEDTLILNWGDFLQALSCDNYISMVHRVQYNLSNSDRYSIPFFFSPDLHAKIIPLTDSNYKIPKSKITNTFNYIDSFKGLSYSDYFNYRANLNK